MGVRINDFDNVKKYQQMQQTRFGQMTQKMATSKSVQKADMNSSIFTSGQNAKEARMTSYSPHNPFLQGHDNPYAYGMLNSTNAQANTRVSSWWENYEQTYAGAKEMAQMSKANNAAAKASQAKTTGQTQSAQAPQGNSTLKDVNTVLNTVKDLVGSGSSTKTGNLMGKVKQYQDSLDKAKTKDEVQNIMTQIQNDKAQATKQNNADKKKVEESKNSKQKAVDNKNQKAEAKEAAEKKKTEADGKVEQSKKNVQTCESNLSTAKSNVSKAKDKLAEEKAKATKDNPNTAAIQAAEQELKKAEEEQKAAEQKLNEAKEELKKAEEEQKAAEKELKQATSEFEKAEKEVQKTEEQVKASEAKEKESTQLVSDFDTLEQNAQKKLNELTQNENTVEQATGSNGNAATDNNSGTVTSTSTSGVKKNDGKSSQLTPEEEQKIENSRMALKFLRPGSSIQCGNDTYTISKDGSIAINGNVMYLSTQRSQAADAAATSELKKILQDKENAKQTS